jgi:hypothetical protein
MPARIRNDEEMTARLPAKWPIRECGGLQFFVQKSDNELGKDMEST